MQADFDIVVRPGDSAESVAHAVIHARQMRRQKGQVVRLGVAGGTHRIWRPVDIGPDDSGLVISAFPGERPVFDGSTVVRGWQETRIGGHVAWVVDIGQLAATLPQPVRSLVINGNNRQRSRWPKRGFFQVDDVPGYSPDDHRLFPGTDRVKLPQDVVDALGDDLQAAELRVLHLWVDERLPVRAFNRQTGEVTFDRHTILGLRAGERHWMSGRCYFENVGARLATPGEWHLDPASNQIIYLPLEGESLADSQIVIPVVQQLIRVIGTPDRPVRDVTIRGLELRYTEWHDPAGTWGKRYDPCVPPAQWPVRAAYRHFQEADGVDPSVEYGAVPQAAFDRLGTVRFLHAHRCNLADCVIHTVGGHAVEVGEGCQDIVIQSNHMHDLGGGGVYVDGGDADSCSVDRTRAIRVIDNTIRELGTIHLAACGVWIGHAAECIVAHNEICRTAYSGISVGWEWRRRLHGSWGNLIERNYIHHIGRRDALSDLAGIYTLGAQANTVIRQNVIHDVAAATYGAWGIYCDAASASITTDGNLVYATQSEPLNNNTGNCENLHRNNILIASGTAAVGCARRWSDWRAEHVEGVAMTFVRNILITDGRAAFRVRRSEALTDPDRGLMFVSDANLLWNGAERPGFAAVEDWDGKPVLCLDRWRDLGNDRASQVVDSGELDRANHRFDLAPAAGLAVGPLSFDHAQAGTRRGRVLG